MDKEKVLKAVLRQTKRIPLDMIDSTEHLWVDCEHGLVCPVVRGMTEEEVLSVLNVVFPDLGKFQETFHKSWEVIKDTPQEELWQQAAIHYFTTYGLEALGIDNEGFIYIPDEIDCTPELRKFRVIQTIKMADLLKMVEDNFASGLALKQSTIQDYLDIIRYFDFHIPQDNIKNKEVKTIFQAETQTVPNNGEEIVRLINYVITDKTMLIKDQATFSAIAGSYYSRLPENKARFIKTILTQGRATCAEVFYRYKPIFLALRKRGYQREVNKIRRLATKLWQPKAGKEFISTMIIGNKEVSPSQLEELPTYDLVKIYNKLNYMLLSVEESNFYYDMVVIRNGNLFIDKEAKHLSDEQLDWIRYALRDILEILRNRCNYVRMIESPNLEVAVPTSEKSFIGDLPLYSRATCSGSSVIGVAWEHNDLDLSALLEDGGKVGWNSYYSDKAKEVLYSGDCTRGGAEALFFKSNQKALIMQNIFRGPIDEVNLFISNEKEFNLVGGSGLWGRSKYIYDPNNIIYSTKLTVDGVGKVLGLYDKQDDLTTFTFVDMTISQSNVCANNILANIAMKVIDRKGRSALKFSDLLEAWTQEDFDIWMAEHDQHVEEDEMEEWEEKIKTETLDLTNPTKYDILSALNGLLK